MSACAACAAQYDAHGLARTGTDQVQRALAAPDAAGLPVDGRRPEHAMTFAAAYARHLPFVDPTSASGGTWEEFFTSDTSAKLAAAATEDVAVYRTTVAELMGRLSDPRLPASGQDMVGALGAVFDMVGTLAVGLDTLKEQLPADEPLRATVGNLIRSRLGAALRELIGFYLAGAALGVVERTATPAPTAPILGAGVVPFDKLLTGAGLSSDWPAAAGAPDWASYVAVDLTAPTAAFGTGSTAIEKVNHLATHNFFTTSCEAFLAGYARVVQDAATALRASLQRSSHQPHYALFLAFLPLLGHARDEVNAFTAEHLAFYYRQVLRLAERPAQPSRAHVLLELAKHVGSHELAQGTGLRAGRDRLFATERDLVANKGIVAEVRRLYRHPALPADSTGTSDGGRIFAASGTGEAESWHPFAERTYRDGRLQSIDMAPAEVGFAVASHHLWLAEGSRTITVQVGSPPAKEQENKGNKKDKKDKKHAHGDLAPADLRCRLTTAGGWLEKPASAVARGANGLAIEIRLDGNDPAITPYDPGVHGYGFGTGQPVLMVTLAHRGTPWSYASLAGIPVTPLKLATTVTGIRSLVLSNDQGQVDAAKPFLAFGSAPTSNSSLVIGCREAFQKAPTHTRLNATLMATPVPHGTAPTLTWESLDGGAWKPLGATPSGTATSPCFTFGTVDQPPVATPDFTADAAYGTSSRGGFVRVRLDRGYGTDTYPVDLAAWVARGGKADEKPTAPVLPMVSSLTLDYDAIQAIGLAEPSEATGRFFHLTPFGHAEQRGSGVRLLPQFLASTGQPAEGELHLGVTGLQPPQNLTLLFQVADGTANPLAAKPSDHLRWSYLRGGDWVAFPSDAVGDLTEGLLASGIVTLAVPPDATSEHTLMPAGMHWIRVAVGSATDAVCRLLGVHAQAVRATATPAAAAPASAPPAAPTVALPAGTIGKLDVPDAAVKSIGQPYPTFGGRPVEDPAAFATRVSEQLRHKNRAIALWDYEHLILAAFPGIYRARCLNHTRYDPSTGSYDELAAGHVTVVTIPDLAVPNPTDPLRPFTSLRVLQEIEQFLRPRMPCFATLHVRNPAFEEVLVSLRVRFRPGVDETFHVNRLQQEITEFLSPWAYRAEARPQFNGKVHGSVLVNFLEDRPYVDYVSDVELRRRLPGSTSKDPSPDPVVGSRAISILVSAPASEHEVIPIRTSAATRSEDCPCPPEVIA